MEEEFAQLVSYVSDNVSHDLDRYALKQIDHMREPLYIACPELDDEIRDRVSDWCQDNNVDEDDVWANFDTDDIFFHDNYINA